MIALSGLRPHEDIPIVFTGIRPGEKLFEELDVSERSAYKTGHARIFVSKIRDAGEGSVAKVLEGCRQVCSGAKDHDAIQDAMRRMVSDVAAEDDGAICAEAQ